VGSSRAGRNLLRLLVVIGLVLGLDAGAERANTLHLVSAEHAVLRPGERIVGLKLTVRSGRIAALPSLPVGWSVTVENYPPWQTRMTGSILIGAAALSPAELKNFVVVEEYGAGTGPFDVELILTVTADFSRERRIRLPMDRLGLRPQ
jgi:hypothetical protein